MCGSACTWWLDYFKQCLDRVKSPSSRNLLWHEKPPISHAPHSVMKAVCLTIWTAHANIGAFSLTIGPSRCLALCRGNRAAQQHIGGSEEASDAPDHVPRPPSSHNLACSVPTQWQTHLRWQLWWTLSSVLVTNAEIIRSCPRKRLIMMHCYCCSHPRYRVHYILTTKKRVWICKTVVSGHLLPGVAVSLLHRSYLEFNLAVIMLQKKKKGLM